MFIFLLAKLYSVFFLLKKASIYHHHSLEAMDEPNNSVVDYTHTLDVNENLMMAIYWRVGGPTYHPNNPNLLRDEWPQDRVVERKWVIRNRNDPGFRVILWRSGWQDWIANNERLMDQENAYLRQLCFGFLYN